MCIHSENKWVEREIILRQPVPKSIFLILRMGWDDLSGSKFLDMVSGIVGFVGLLVVMYEETRGEIMKILLSKK